MAETMQTPAESPIEAVLVVPHSCESAGNFIDRFCWFFFFFVLCSILFVFLFFLSFECAIPPTISLIEDLCIIVNPYALPPRGGQSRPNQVAPRLRDERQNGEKGPAENAKIIGNLLSRCQTFITNLYHTPAHAATRRANAPCRPIRRCPPPFFRVYTIFFSSDLRCTDFEKALP